jgi:hypothetical protein
MSIKCHRGIDGLRVGHVKPLEHILYILGLTRESPFLHLLDLKSKEELQFTHHRHLKSLGHDPTKLFTKFIISRTKDNIININLAYKDIFSISLNEESRIGFAYLKTVLEKKFFKAFIPCSRSLLKPLECLTELVHMVGEVWIFKARWFLNIYFFLERLSHPVSKPNQVLPICMPGSSSIHIVTSLVNNRNNIT